MPPRSGRRVKRQRDTLRRPTAAVRFKPCVFSTPPARSGRPSTTLIPPLSRIDLDDVLGLVREKKYFVLHAPRQTGKTSALLALADLLKKAATAASTSP